MLLTSDAWRVVMDIDLRAYHDTIAAIKSDLIIVEQRKQDLTPMGELKQIYLSLETIESRLNDFQQISPGLDRRRGLLNVGGMVMKHVFGIATIADVHTLHEVVEALKQQNSDIAHSIDSQLSYVKDIGKLNTEAVVNLSSVVKDQMVQAHEQLSSLTRDIFLLNATLHSGNSVFTAIRHLEFALIQLVQQIDELFDTVQYAILGKLPIKFVNSAELQNILRNVTLQLPESYELLVGSNKESIHWYYELIKVAVVANGRSVSVVLTVPLKTADSHFTLFKLYALPTLVSPGKFVTYTIDYPYLALQPDQRSYLLLTEAEYNRCNKGRITLCFERTVVYSSQLLNCEASLFFHVENANLRCRRKVIFHHSRPILHHHEGLWIYHFPEKQRVALHCPHDDKPARKILTLTGNGLLHDAAGCSITSDSFRIFPELHGTTRAKVTAPTLHLPENPTIVTEAELQQLVEVPPLDLQTLTDLRTRLMAPTQTYDIDTLLHAHQTSRLQEQRTSHFIVITTAISAIVICSICCVIFHFYPRYGRYCVCRTDKGVNAVTTPTEVRGTEDETAQPNVLFTSYSLQGQN